MSESPHAVPKPRVRPQRVDVWFVHPQPTTTVAIAFADNGGPTFHYHATSGDAHWRGTVIADTVEAAVLDVVTGICAGEDAPDRVRFLVNLPAGSSLWRHTREVESLLPGMSIEMPAFADLALMQTARGGLGGKTTPHPAGTANRSADRSPLWVATDGSVRGKVTGYGWLASNGEHGLTGFPHFRKMIGPKVVLIAELRAITDAVRSIHGRALTLLSDSQDALAMVRQWMDGADVLPAGYTTERSDGRQAGLVIGRALIHEQRDRITPVWVRGHQGHPLNEGADALARLASRRSRGRSGLMADDYHRRAAELAHAFAAEFRRTRGFSA